jgi:hypothetical protein
MRTRRIRHSLWAVAAASVLVLATAAPAYADTSQASANAAVITLATATVVSSGAVTSTNDGTTETITGNDGPALSVLGVQNLINAGVLTQKARSFSNGDSGACAGLVAPGGTITIGVDGNCTFAPGTGGLRINLGGFSILADAIYSLCVANSNGGVLGSATLVNARIVPVVLGIDGAPVLAIPVSPGPNTLIGIPGVLTVGLNVQTTPVPGSITVNALDVNVLGGTVRVKIGSVACGPNAKTGAVSAFPAGSAPIVLATLAVTGGAIVVRRRIKSRGAVAAV